MPRNARQIIAEADRKFPVRVRIAVPAQGFGRQLNVMMAWLDQNAGADGWQMTPAGTRGIVNDAVAIHFLDATMANAFVGRWCMGYRVVPEHGAYHMRQDEPKPRVLAPAHSTPHSR